MRCDAMRCDAMRCDAMRCDAMRCDAMRCDAIIIHILLRASGQLENCRQQNEYVWQAHRHAQDFACGQTGDLHTQP